MEIPQHYSLHSENDSHFVIHDGRDGNKFQVAKKELHPAHQIKIMKMQKFSEGTDDVEPVEDDSSDDAAPEENAVPASLQANPPDAQPAQPPPVDMNAGITDQAPQGAPNPDQGMQIPAGPAQVTGSGATVQNVQGLVNQEAGAEMKAAQGQVNLNKEQSKQMDPYLYDERVRQGDFQSRMETYQQRADQIVKDIADNKIDPKQYWHNASTGQKISAGVAMVLGGLSQGLLRSNVNPGFAAIEDTINKDIDAQKSELGKKQSLLGDNLRMQGNLMAADQATRLHANSILQGQLQKTALDSGNPIVMAKAQEAVAHLKLQAIPMIQGVAMNQTRMQVLGALQKGDVSQQDPAKFVQWVVPPPQQKAVFGEIERAQDTRRMSKNIMDTFDQASKEVHGLQGVEQAATLGHYRATAVGGLHQALQPTFKDLEGTVRQAAMDNTFENVSPTPFDTASRIKEKRGFLENYLKSKASAPTAKGFGIDLDKFNSTHGYESPQISMKGGVPYQKVQGGWKRVSQ